MVQPGFDPKEENKEHIQELPATDEVQLKTVMEGNTLKQKIANPIMKYEELDAQYRPKIKA